MHVSAMHPHTLIFFWYNIYSILPISEKKKRGYAHHGCASVASLAS